MLFRSVLATFDLVNGHSGRLKALRRRLRVSHPHQRVLPLTSSTEPSSGLPCPRSAKRLPTWMDVRTPSYNVLSPPTLLVAGLLHGGPILLDPSSLESTPSSGHRILVGTLYGEHSGTTWRGGELGLVAVKMVEDSYARVPHDVRKEAMLLGKMDHPNVSPALSLRSQLTQTADPRSSERLPPPDGVRRRPRSDLPPLQSLLPLVPLLPPRLTDLHTRRYTDRKSVV